MSHDTVEVADLHDCIGSISRQLKSIGQLRGNTKRNAKAHLRASTLKLLGYVATHRQSCRLRSCECRRLAEFCPADVLFAVPDITKERKIVVYPAQHVKSCQETWDRDKPPYYCELSCESKAGEVEEV